MKKWNTLLQLNRNHPLIGEEGLIYFIVDTPIRLGSGEIEYVLAQPAFTKIGAVMGLHCS